MYSSEYIRTVIIISLFLPDGAIGWLATNKV